MYGRFQRQQLTLNLIFYTENIDKEKTLNSFRIKGFH